MLAKEALEKSKMVKCIENVNEDKEKDVDTKQINYIKQEILYYSHNGYMRIYKQFYILPEVLEYYLRQGYTLCQGCISWKNATYGDALESNILANEAFIKKVSRTMFDTVHCGCRSRFDFSKSHKHCTGAINLLENLGYTVFEEKEFLVVSFVEPTDANYDKIPDDCRLPIAKDAKNNCIRKQIQLIDALIEKSVYIGYLSASISSLSIVLNEVIQHYTSLGYQFTNDSITWDNPTEGEALEKRNSVFVKKIHVEIERACYKRKTSLFLNYQLSSAVITKLLNEGYNITIYTDGIVVSWDKAFDNSIGKLDTFNVSCVDKQPELVYDSVYRQCT